MEEIRSVFGRNVQKYRQLRHWTQAQLAEKIDVSDAFMAHIEHGTRGASMETIELIARCFEIPYTALFEESEEKNSDYAQILFMLEADLKNRLCTDVDECIKIVKTKL